MKRGPQLPAEHWPYLVGALGIHGLLAAIVIAMGWVQLKPVTPQLAVTAVIVDSATLAKASQATQAAKVPEPAPVAAEPPPKPAIEHPKREPDDAAERQRQQPVQQRQVERDLQLQRQAEAQQQQLKDAQRKAAEAQAQQQRLQQAEQQRLADLQQKQRDAELRRQAEADAKAQKLREAELSAQLAAEEGRNTAVNAGLLNQYVALIQQKVMRYWIKPPTARAGLECEVKVTQALGGTVLSVAIGRCNGDQAVRASIETAVNAASPLPAPPDPRLFDRNLAFNFKPTD